MTTVRKLRKGGSKKATAAPTSAKWDRWSRGPSKKLQLSDSPMADDGSPQASLYYFTEDSWDRFTEWSMNPTALRIGPSVFNLTLAENSLCWKIAWKRDRVAFMNSMFCLQIDNEYQKCKADKRGYIVPNLLLAYGEESFHLMGGLIKSGVDVDRLYFPLVCKW
ncbi:hypothetical protein Bca52824_035256 [Brassica carinata]|uniref:Uncharacterized protein n=1 Tax=Brassica carinata TaxID=52824 RepID=A0A8X7V1J6_BRACI|nr:hypothetical protein Bca52824_035256 [Brassica carinata]